MLVLAFYRISLSGITLLGLRPLSEAKRESRKSSVISICDSTDDSKRSAELHLRKFNWKPEERIETELKPL